MKESFYTKLKELMSKKDGLTSRKFIFEEPRYEEIISEVKEAKEKRKIGQSLTSKDYRRINRFDVINIDDKEMLIEKPTEEMTNIKYFCRFDQIYDTIHSAHSQVGHKKEKAMEAELKKKICNTTREVIKIYLDLCEPCALKKKSKSKGLVVKPIIMTALNSRCQVDLIDMPSEPDVEYKFILNYQDHLTKFVVLRPLKTKTADEVSDVLLDIFCLFGAPYILHSDNGREFCNQVIEKLEWSAIKLVHGKPRHSQSQESIERGNQDIRDSLVAWMADNNTSGWANGLRIIQNTKNNTYHSGIKRTPYEAMFGSPQKNGLLDSPLTADVVKKITTEEELEGELSKIERSLKEVDNEERNSVDETVSKIVPRTVDNKHVEKETTSSDTITLYDIDCDKGNSCFECGQHIHNKDSNKEHLDLPLCTFCSRKSAIETTRENCATDLKSQAPKMWKNTERKITPVSVGENVLVNIPDVGRGRLAPRNVMAVVINKNDDHYTLGTKHGVLDKQFSRNQFQVAPDKFINTIDIPDEQLNVRKEAIMSSGSKQDFIKCGCKKNCSRKSCKCVKSNTKCNSKCHGSTSCANK